jgi:hypothetical protein
MLLKYFLLLLETRIIIQLEVFNAWFTQHLNCLTIFSGTAQKWSRKIEASNTGVVSDERKVCFEYVERYWHSVQL